MIYSLYVATDTLSGDIHPRKMIKMVRRVLRDHIIIQDNSSVAYMYIVPLFTLLRVVNISVLQNGYYADIEGKCQLATRSRVSSNILQTGYEYSLGQKMQLNPF